MKFRTDFVTNSSSSGFVAITVELTDGETIDFEWYYDAGYGGYLWNSWGFDDVFDDVEDGTDILEALSENINNFEHIKDDQDYVAFASKVGKIESVDKIKSISLGETTNFDDGDTKDYDFSYSFAKTKSKCSFNTADELEPSFLRTVASYGEFNDGDGVLKHIKTDLDCLYEGDYEDILDLPDLLKKRQSKIKYLVVGDITAEKFINGKRDSFLSRTMKQQEKEKLYIIREKDFLMINELPFPDETEKIGTLSGKTVTFLEPFEYGSIQKIRKTVTERGGIANSHFTRDTDIVVFGDACLKSERGYNSKGSELDKAAYSRDKSGKPIICTENQYMDWLKNQPITSAQAAGESSKKEMKTFVFNGFNGATTKKMKEKVASSGGVVRSRVSKSTTYLVYNEYYVGELAGLRDAQKINAEGGNITLLTKYQFDMLLL